MTTDKHHYGPAERSKEMLLKHAPRFVCRHEDGTLDYTLPTVAGFSPEEVETLIAAFVAGKEQATAAERNGVGLAETLAAAVTDDEKTELVAARGISDEETMWLMQWAVKARVQAVSWDLLNEEGETEYARRFLNGCHDEGLLNVLHAFVRDLRKETKGWSEDDWMQEQKTACFHDTLLQKVLGGKILPTLVQEGGELVSFVRTAKGTQEPEEWDTGQDRG